MIFKRLTSIGLVAIPLLLLLTAGCSGQKTDDMEIAEQTPPPSGTEDAGMTQTAAPEPPPPPPRPAAPAHPQRLQGTVPEERPRSVAPPRPAPVSVTIPMGTSLSLNLAAPLTSENAQVGDSISATLNNPLIVGDRVVFPAGSSIQGKVSDVKPATKGFKETGGALSVHFNRITAPDGHSASISAGYTKVAEGSAGKKAGIIGGSAAGGALLGKLLGKDAKGAALIGGAVGTAVAGSTKGKEAIIQPDEAITVGLEKSAQTTLRP